MTTTPEPVEIHWDRTTAAKAARAGRAGLLGGAGAFLACALVCCFPLLAAAVAAIGLGTLATGAWAIGVVLLAAAVGTVLLGRRRRRAAHGSDASCDGG